ncbi:MAG TPA: LON peptidase substrate-binding domain-containing protein, partial [Myxococcota bacterium]|nr:LON peptidase substrate-binding domain-containing protein [Myxococcota bacterium]
MDEAERIEEQAGGMEIEVGRGPDEEGDERTELPGELPVLPLKNTVLFPYLLSPLLVNTPASQRLVDEVLLRPDRLMVCTAVKRDVAGPPGPDDVYSVGTVLRIVKMLKFPDDSYRLLVQGVARVHLGRFTTTDPFLRAEIERREDVGEEDESVEMTALVRSVAQQFSTLVSESPRLSDELQVLVANLADPSKLADLVASNLDLDVDGKQQILEADHVGIRLRLVLDQLSKETEALQIESEIKQKVQTEMGRTQREYMLRTAHLGL